MIEDIQSDLDYTSFMMIPSLLTLRYEPICSFMCLPNNTIYKHIFTTIPVLNGQNLVGRCKITCSWQTWSSLDLSLGLETSRDPFLQVLVSVLVLEPQSLGLGLGLGTLESRSWSWSWSWNSRVSVSVLVLGLATMKTRFSSLMKREIETK